MTAFSAPVAAQTSTTVPPQAYGPVWTDFHVGTALGGGASAFASQDTTFHGWTVGPGVETVATGSRTTRVEYRYSQFQQLQIVNGVGIQSSTHTIRAGLSCKFGIGSPALSTAGE